MGPKEPICPEQKFFRINHCCYFHLPMALFIVQNLKKILQWIQNYDYAPFLGPKGPFAPNKNFSRKPDNEPCLFSLFLFFLKIITIILIYLLTLFFVQNLKKILPADPELWKMCNLWAHSGHLFPQIRIFSENLLMSLISFIHAYLHAKYQSQILIY